MRREGAYEFEKNEDGVTITKFIPERDLDGPLVLPCSLGGQAVTQIGTGAFEEHGTQITSLTVPEGVKRIGPGALTWMLFLSELHLPESLEALGAGFEAGSGLSKVLVPRHVKNIEDIGSCSVDLLFEAGNPVYSSDGFGIFERSKDQLVLQTTVLSASRTVYDVPDGVTRISSEAFRTKEDLRTLTLPASIRYIEEGAFCNLTHRYSENRGVMDVHFRAPQTADPGTFTGQKRGIYREVRERDGTLRAIYEESKEGNKLFQYFGSDERLELPEGITALASGALYRCPAKEVILPRSLRSIHPEAFLFAKVKRARFLSSGLNILFPDAGTYLQEKLMEGFGANDKLYDFSYYDSVLVSGLLDQMKARMVLERLRQADLAAADLSERTADSLRKALKKRVSDLFAAAAVKDDLAFVRELAGWDSLDENDFETGLAKAQEAGRQDIVTFLVRKKLERFASEGFDFSL